MRQFLALTKRHTLVFFKDKGTVISALMAPLILILLYVLFLGNVFEESFNSAVYSAAPDLVVDKDIMNAYIGGWELSSILAVCGVTIAFVANLTMVQDKVNGSINDIMVAPVKDSILALSYYVSTAFVTIVVNLIALGVGFIYLAIVGWFLSFTDVLLLIADVFILSMFGTAFSSVVVVWLKTQGAMSAVGVVVSSVYGFVCGAYYPVSQFAEGIKNTVMFFPGTYGTGLFRNHFLNTVLNSFADKYGFPPEVVEEMKDGFDINLYFFDSKVELWVMYLVVGLVVVVLFGFFVLFTNIQSKNKECKK